MTNERIMFIHDFNLAEAVGNLLGLDGYTSYNLGKINWKEFGDCRQGFTIEEIKKVMGAYKNKVDVVTIDGVIEDKLNVVQAIRPEQGERIYDGKIMIYPPFFGHDGLRGIKQSGADFAFNPNHPEDLIEAFKAIFDQKPIPDGFSYHPQKYAKTRGGILVPLLVQKE